MKPAVYRQDHSINEAGASNKGDYRRDFVGHGSLLAGGGMRTGQVIGSTNRFGEEPDSRPVHYKDVLATLYHNMGINIKDTPVMDTVARPHYLLPDNEPIAELI